MNINELQIMNSERQNCGTTPTNNEDLEKSGYVVVRNICDPEELYHPIPRERGTLVYFRNDLNNFSHDPKGQQVEGSLSRIHHPQYKMIFKHLRKKIEEVIGRKIIPTFYYDRYYFEGQSLPKFTTNNACEISCIVSISNNLEEPWPHWIKTTDVYTDAQKSLVLIPGEERSLVLEPGDALIYKGCERPLWKDEIPSPKPKLFGRKSKRELYSHEVCFNYVLADGLRSHES